MFNIEDSYNKFIKESVTDSPEFGQVVFYSTYDAGNDTYVKQALERIFKYCDNPDELFASHLLTVDPMVLWERRSLLDKHGISDAIGAGMKNSSYVYNSPHGIIINTEDMLKLLKKTGFQYMPKTVFTKEDAKKELKFPLIAKTVNSYQSRGVEKIDNKRQLNKLDSAYTIFQDQINIDKEYRMVFFCGKKGSKLIAVFRRDPLNDKSKELRESEKLSHSDLEKKERSNFSWTQIDPTKHSNIDIAECYEIANFIFACCPTLKISGLDIAIDDKGKHWFIESNSTPGLISNLVPLIYKYVYEDAIGTMQPYTIKRLQELSFYYANLKMQEDKYFKVEDSSVLANFFGYK
jgi:hypothetical protein